MNQIVTRSLCITILLSSSMAIAAALPYIAFRSQGFNAARELVGWQTTINRGDTDSYYTSFSITPEYTRSFRAGNLAGYLFGDAMTNNCAVTDHCFENRYSNNDCSFIKIQGSEVANRDPQALMAENFYLPTDFNSQVSVEPVISNWLIDFNLYFGFDQCHPGLYFRIHTPLTRTRWALNYCEDVLSNGQNNYDPGYFNDTFVETFTTVSTVYGLYRTQLLENFTQYAVDGDAITGVSGITYEGLRNARFASRPLTKTDLAELTAALGWNFIACEDYHFGFQIRAAAPTGNKPRGYYLFEPIVGNGHHWELGAGLTTHFSLYKSEDECQNLSMYIDWNMTHLFKSCQWRTFDLCGKPLSRYMLAMAFTTSVVNLQDTTDSVTYNTPSAQFAKSFSPVANFSTIPVEVSYPLQTDLVFKLAFTNNNFQWDIGYDFWYRSCTKFNKISFDTHTYTPNTWALKGDAFVFGFPDSQPAIPLSATELNATIFAGTNNFAASPSTWNQNPGIDNKALATDGTVAHDPLNTSQAIANFVQVFTSQDPQLLQNYALDIDAAKSRGLSQKVFTHFNYMWKQYTCWTPYLGIGGEVEFAKNSHDSACCSNNSCNLTLTTPQNIPCCHSNHLAPQGNNCKHCTWAALSQWGIWIKGGVAFN